MQLGRNRVEALTDGVFAVAMTLLVLDIKVPELEQAAASAELPYRLLALWPKFLSYAISFVILGVYWVGHHLQLPFIRSADRSLLWINILFLLWVALVPFSTALLSEYTKHRLAIAVYGGNMIASGLTLALHWWYATARRRHVMNTSTIMRTPLNTRRFAIAMIERMKQARNTGAAMTSRAGE